MDENTAFMKFRELVERAGLPEADVKRYIRTYSEFFTSTKQSRSRLYAPDSVDRLNQIAELEAMGTSVQSIRGILRGGGAEPGKPVNPAPAGDASALSYMGETLTLGALSDIKGLQESVRDLQDEVNVLRDKLAEHEQRLIGDHQQIRLLRHDVDVQKTEALARKMEARSTWFWKRLFGRKGA